MAKFAIITGASTGIGRELAKLAAADGYDLLLAADTPFVDNAGELPGNAQTLETDLSTFEGVDRLIEAAGGRQIDLLCANAGHGLGRGFLEQAVAEWRHVIDTNVTGTTYLLQKVLKQMVAQGEGKVLVTGSIAGWMPGSFQAVYNGTKAFVDNFTAALRNELKEHEGITITTLEPGPVETEFFKRADMMDTSVGQSDSKSDPADVAKDGWDALMAGKDTIISGWKNKLQVAAAGVMPQSVPAEIHRKMAEPGSADKG
ncbi:SDR family NAD(P)-dependent oxidoreductase [Sphingomonas sp.]|jgi:short-subunit dehydrogenase|uniref:SDR family NAD(P)-dependent oxidoreductase n=1 Tax=Sphingomonas sp. TaxID=28214 RepID=UPI002E31773A|nr:SDR family NAD(P)-dependent oxidoreductase [Sphingomonas sp.]HEX4693446.1 SDR family NAD(P)-dependent oxidoreductase [Sphingomonas sp.]